MFGLMMDRPLLISSILRHAEQYHGDIEIVSRTHDFPEHRTTYRGWAARCRKLANALEGLGIRRGDRVATLAWNDFRHFELYHGVSGMGAIIHTLNPRLHPAQLIYIVNHARDRVICLDPQFLKLVEAVQDQIPHVEKFILLCAEKDLPATSLRNVVAYETLMDGASDRYDWPEFDERTAAGLCYTSGTTGNPKGVLYSHRSTVLHAYGMALLPIMPRKGEATLLVVPLFHANAWGYPYAAPMTGGKLVLPGPKLDGASLYELFENERVKISSGVPTVWLGLLGYLKETGKRLTTLKTVTVGGSALAKEMVRAFEEDHGITCYQGWGMTETSPLGTFCTLLPDQESLPAATRHELKTRQGPAIYGCELKIVDEDERALPWDGVSRGELCIRGPWITSGYYEDAAATAKAFTQDGWFKTGDMSVIHSDGFMQIVDRAKDVIKSGGEWISSIDLENAALGHPAVAQAAVIARPHPKWAERPLMVVAPIKGKTVTKEELLTFLETQVAKWWLPDDIVFVESLPIGATGKIQKARLREDFKDYALPGTPAEAATAAE